MEPDVRQEEKITKIHETLDDNFMQYENFFSWKIRNEFCVPAYALFTLPKPTSYLASRQMEMFVGENKCTVAFIRSPFEDLPKIEEKGEPMIIKAMMGAWRRTI